MPKKPRVLPTPRYAKPPGCAGCPLEHAGYGFAPPSGSEFSRLVFVGEALGVEEGVRGEPFQGAAGGVLSRLLHGASINRDHVRIANVVSCRPPEDHLSGASYEFAAITQCRQYLQPVLDRVPDNAVVAPLGGTALQAILNLHGVPGVSVKNFHGTVTRDPSDRFWVVPTFHPSYLQRGAMGHYEVVRQDIIRAERVSREGFRRKPANLVVDPPVEHMAALFAAHLQRVQHDPDGAWASIDTEFRGKTDDESEISDVRGVVITRFNISFDDVTGYTVPYVGEYRRIVHEFLAALGRLRGIIFLWNKYADWSPLAADGAQVQEIEAYDLMWLWHFLQSDLPLALGFVAPLASDFGAWKHWAKFQQWEGQYAAADPLQTQRVGLWLVPAAMKSGLWDPFVRDWHERDRYILREAHVQGVPVNRPVLEDYHRELQGKLAKILERIKTTAAAGVLKPKAGYAKMPSPKIPAWFKACAKAKHHVTTIPHADHAVVTCHDCARLERVDPVAPPASILGKPKRGGAEAKTAYMREGVKLVEKQIEVEEQHCDTCGAAGVSAKHRCPKPKVRAPRARAAGKRGRLADAAPPAGDDQPHADPGDRGGCAERSSGPALRTVKVLRPRYFWQLPFNPDAPAQILAYLAQQGIAAPEDRKTGKKTTNKQALGDLAKQHESNPFFQLQLDWKAVQKVDSTYAVGTLNRLDANDRIHPEIKPLPATQRDSCVDPNLQNVVADKAGPEGLASGFRKCIEAREGLPPGVTAAEYAAWEARWTS